MSELKIITAQDVTLAVAEMCVRANRNLAPDVYGKLRQYLSEETCPNAREILRQLLENADLAAQEGLPLCQDTGMAVFFVELGQELRLNGDLYAAINEGVRMGYGQGYLRKSICDPFSRKNTGDNTPAVIHLSLTAGDSLRIAYLAKGGGSENMSRVTMLTPAQGRDGIKDFVLRLVVESGGNPCPPIIIGLGVGGSFDTAPILAKKALLRPLDQDNPDPELRRMEKELLELVNQTGVGPMGLGGKTTCLGVRINAAPCHIASLPLAVNIQCHSSRHAEAVL